MTAIVLSLKPTLELTDDQFYELCQNNHDLQLERTADGELIIMPPVGGESGRQEADILIDLGNWNRQTKLGVVFSSSTCFKLPNGANRSPDAAWIKRKHWQALTPEQQKKFPPISPDFVIELRSETDPLQPLQQKMQEYIDNGVKLGWLINPQDRTVEIYRLGQAVEILNSPKSLSGENLLTGFVLDVINIFNWS
ncbi:Uma2 family endonuclease [Gloeocapsopsis dulcis]|uniref:Putative restriction endonuclease domain-containing protein n=1 Tax=Gloeocapsopsis dulcis AAB1 = 1H9 TaxID=1433147 RepID=A0A6N8FXY2_9CHRO|nr:Uma2 family endonuclease [Gloeocapsopsis dulcis]MUL37933.1 hypothetical protein [Gloeocapsopsis dulcis AAB1 = 1H9]WNN87329.1 Uma2 family endonuclease [Gloeocapsopsis dulcis]